MKLWELLITVSCLSGLATFWAFPEWWDKNWRDLRPEWWERVAGMLIVGFAGYQVGLYVAQGG